MLCAAAISHSAIPDAPTCLLPPNLRPWRLLLTVVWKATESHQKLRALIEWPLPAASLKGQAWSGRGEDKASSSSKRSDPVMTGPIPSILWSYLLSTSEVLPLKQPHSPQRLWDWRVGPRRLQQRGGKALRCARARGTFLRPPSGGTTHRLCSPGRAPWDAEMRRWKPLTGLSPALCPA